ncbi:MAG: peptide ABC transporter substrate-binding protein [Lachnospiraceae bacterium]|nr:peptide ABC transporter substrate-binding protein [Lachnospiraceae bacterium]
MKKRALALILSVVTAMGMLTACGGSTGASTSSEPAAASTDAAAVETEAAEPGAPVESTIYPTPEGVTYKPIAEGKSAPDWSEYEALIKEIKTTTDMTNRVALMHKAEDILMGTAAVIPIYYYNDLYLQKTDVEGIYSNLFGFKYFQFATCPRDVLKINLASEPAKVDPALNSSVDGACLAVNMFEGLYTYDKDGNLQPALAENTEVSEDGLTYTFTLRDGLKWSDGTDLTAKDFEYSWKRAAAPETGADYGYMFDAIAKADDGSLDVTASEDGKTLTVNLVAPCAYFLDLAAFPAYLPVPQAQVEAAEGWETNPGAWAAEAGFVTNGAYTMTDWKHEESIVLKKNDNYWRADEVTIPEIDLMLSADDTAIFSAYNAGDLDFADTVPTNEIASLKGNEDFHVIDNLGTYYAAFNVNSPIFEGKTVDQAIAMRKAFAILIDRPYIVETVGQTGQKVATSYIPEGMADGNGGVFKVNGDSYTFPVEDGYYPEEVDDAAVDEAIALLEYAGYKFDDNGMLSAETPINITYLTNDGTGHIGVAEIMQQDLAEVGITMTIDTREWNVFLDERKQGNFDFAREGWLADFNDPINMLEMWTTDSGNNDCQFGR